MNRPGTGLLKIVAVIGTSIVSAAASAYDGPYVGLQFGINKADDISFDLAGTRTALTQPPVIVELPQIQNSGPAGDYGFEKNVLGQFVVGYKFPIGIRPEFELSLRRERANSITNPDGSMPDPKGTRLTTVSGFANLWYDFFPSWRIHPYIGGGGGINRFILNNAQTNALQVLLANNNGDLGANPESRKADDARFGYQFGGGIQVDVFKGMTLGIDYRNMRSAKADFYPYVDQPQTYLRGRYKTESLTFSVKYYFVQPPPPPAPPVAEPEPAVVPVAAPVDTDGDGVVDGVDQCPDSPPGSVVDATGCPPPPPAPVCKTPGPGEKISLAGCGTGDNIVLKGVNFDTNKATLTLNAKSLLDGVVGELTEYPTIHVQVGGHTDSRGSAKLNEGLSQRRAASVVKYLSDKGVAGSRMTSAGFGASQPIADNGTTEGQDLNRRVELKIVSGSGVREVPAAAAAPAAAESASAEVAPEAAAEAAPAEDAPAAPTP